MPGIAPQPTRRRLLLAGLACGGLLLGGRSSAKGRVLVTGPAYMGGRLLQRVNEGGFPDLQRDNFGPMTLFIAPVAVAVSPMRDIYVADAGLSALFRYDPMQDAMSVIRGARVTQQTRLAALSDGSVMVANGSSALATRFARNGRQMQTLDPQLGLAHFDEIAVDSTSGRYYGLDRVQGRLEEIMPHGHGATVLADGILPEQPMTMAMDGQTLYVAGRTCQCVVAIEMSGARPQVPVLEESGQIAALAAGDGWLVAADMRDRVVRVWRQNEQVASYEFASLGLTEPRGMAIAGQTLYVVDTAARRVQTFRMRA
ncbi:MAG: hypothetical protein D3M94_01520 [Rhodocyclales bacterium GT-UBC]|nr:MAG: hypothetical protein D3M94_01520 [Rhodocyclales bacterium GT-UBC]